MQCSQELIPVNRAQNNKQQQQQADKLLASRPTNDYNF